ncbi:hypothetical protein Q2K19_12975 [Micromonospora soli]|uniref:hypothetical protein n=1 Tax=Micromonospora sp. NBRC 110009 TaxID=3061627 RepID=UPI0026715D39|nr:hypothetical protein [Micromonospora sp. NBRC 110009]WKU01309.1 hypothetical protein Q2K19_12975 [Micromonospora sp. NBRC 110009]
MTRSIRGSRGAALLLAGTAAASLLLSGCGAGQVAETANKIPSVQGVNVQTPDNLFKVRGLYVQYPGAEGYQSGADAPLNVVIYNDSPSPVTVTVTTDSARDIQLTGAAQSGGPSAAPTGSPTEPASKSPSPTQSNLAESPSASPSGSASASPSASPSESAPAGKPARLDIPANGYVQLNSTGGQFLQLVGLNDKLLSGQQVNLTFDFGDGHTIKTAAPIGVPLTPAARPSPVVHPREEAGEQGGAEDGSHG